MFSAISSAAAELQQNTQAAEFLLTRRLAAGLFKTLIMVPLPMWQLKDCPAVIIAPINKAKATICFPALNTIYHLTNGYKGNIWCHTANYWLPLTNIGFRRLSSSCRGVCASHPHAVTRTEGKKHCAVSSSVMDDPVKAASRLSRLPISSGSPLSSRRAEWRGARRAASRHNWQQRHVARSHTW